MNDNKIRNKLRWALHILYNENATLTVVDDSFACFYRWNRNKKEVEFPYNIALHLIHQDLVDLDSGNDYYKEENYVANKKNIENIVQNIRCSVGDTVRVKLKNYEHIELSGFVTKCNLNELKVLYINDLVIIPTEVALTRKILIEKTLTFKNGSGLR
ncbi:MAG: hypothetical protein Q8O88_04070 [bacterium]|nr:hypothetical protein [bacterium]